MNALMPHLFFFRLPFPHKGSSWEYLTNRRQYEQQKHGSGVYFSFVSHRGAGVCLLSLSVCHRYEALESAPLSEAERGAFAQIICGRCLFLLNKWRAEKVGTSGLVTAGYLRARALRSAEYCMPYRCRAETRVTHTLHKELSSASFPSPPVNSVYPCACSPNTRTASAWVSFVQLNDAVNLYYTRHVILLLLMFKVFRVVGLY